MENKEMNTEKIRFYKKHPVLTAWLLSVIVALPVSYSVLMVSTTGNTNTAPINIPQVNNSVKALMISKI